MFCSSISQWQATTGLACLHWNGTMRRSTCGRNGGGCGEGGKQTAHDDHDNMHRKKTATRRPCRSICGTQGAPQVDRRRRHPIVCSPPLFPLHALWCCSVLFVVLVLHLAPVGRQHSASRGLLQRTTLSASHSKHAHTRCTRTNDLIIARRVSSLASL